MTLTPPFTSNQYIVDVITPVHVGDAKEKEYFIGQDYFYNDQDKKYCFFNKKELQKLLGTQLSVYVQHLINNNTNEASKVVKKICNENPALIYKKVSCPFKKDTIQKVYTTGLGIPTIPGSTLKGAIRSVIGKMIMRELKITSLGQSDLLFGKINDNFMRLIQVSDVTLDCKTKIFPFKIFSGDINGNYGPAYTGKGMWKDSRIGGHNSEFNEKGFETFYETYSPGSRGSLRVNFGEGLIEYISKITPDKLPKNSSLLNKIKNNQWLNLIQQHSQFYLEKEKAFFQKFQNDDFDFAVDLIDELIEFNNEPNSALLRIGQGSGFHAITGDWQHPDFTQTGLANPNAIKSKTRKIAFNKIYHDDDDTELEFFFPGYILISQG
jgi:CRISPR/Cas system CSM-associated protein Csm5 (group 7 of RAMP superfamily)